MARKKVAHASRAGRAGGKRRPIAHPGELISISLPSRPRSRSHSHSHSHSQSRVAHAPSSARALAKRTTHPRRKAVGGFARGSADKGLFGRSVLDINILRLLGVKLPAMTGLIRPPSDTGHHYALTDDSGKHTMVLNDDVEAKHRPASPTYRAFSSAEEARAYADAAPGTAQLVFTDGSFFPRTGQTGYAVWWGHNHANNASGPVPPSLPLSSARAEEYAIFLALLQIKLETRFGSTADQRKYEICTDSTWTIAYIAKWFRKWDKASSKVGWRTPPSKSTYQRDVLRVSAGILWDLRFGGTIVQFTYVPGHTGIEGNEAANTMCRHAARSGETRGPRPIAF